MTEVSKKKAVQSERRTVVHILFYNLLILLPESKGKIFE